MAMKLYFFGITVAACGCCLCFCLSVWLGMVVVSVHASTSAVKVSSPINNRLRLLLCGNKSIVEQKIIFIIFMQYLRRRNGGKKSHCKTLSWTLLISKTDFFCRTPQFASIQMNALAWEKNTPLCMNNSNFFNFLEFSPRISLVVKICD